MLDVTLLRRDGLKLQWAEDGLQDAHLPTRVLISLIYGSHINEVSLWKNIPLFQRLDF